MKKFFVLMAVCLLISGCGKKEQPEDPTSVVQSPNPMVSYENIDDINKAVGGKIKRAENAKNESYIVINNEIEEYAYTVDGLQYTIRFAKQKDYDISGFYINGKEVFEGNAENWAVNSDSECKLCRFLTSDGQYVIAVNDKGSLEEDIFNEICTAIAEGINN